MPWHKGFAMRETAGTAETLERLSGAEMTPGICYVCPFNCPTEVYTKAGKIVYIKGNQSSPNQGSRCIKGQASHYLPTDPDRLKYPMRRVAPGKFERISWDAAFDLIAEKLAAIKAKWGPEHAAGYRKIHLTTKQKGLTVQTRDGYYAK